jgi:hypothetical protein
MYAGVPTVDLGFECSSDDCKKRARILDFCSGKGRWRGTELAWVNNGKVMLLLEVRKGKRLRSWRLRNESSDLFRSRKAKQSAAF